MKKGCPVVLAENSPEVVQVIKKEAKVRSAPLTLVRKEDYRILEEGYDGNSFIYQGDSYQIPLPGRHQISNAVTAIVSLQLIFEKIEWENIDKNTGEYVNQSAKENANANTDVNKNLNANKKINENTDEYASQNAEEKEYIKWIQTGLSKTSWPGRLEIIGRNPLIYRDGAHNADGAAALAAFVEKHFTNRRIIYIMGILSDKEVEKMVETLVPSADRFYVFTPNNHRGLAADRLAQIVRASGREAYITSDVNEAMRQARKDAGMEDVLVLCGSLSFMEEMVVEKG